MYYYKSMYQTWAQDDQAFLDMSGLECKIYNEKKTKKSKNQKNQKL